MNNTKQYLNRIKRLDCLIDNKKTEMEQLKLLAQRVTVSLDGRDRVQTSKSGDTIGSAVAKLIDLEAEIERTVDSYIQIKKEIVEVIEQVGDEKLIDLLYKKYVNYRAYSTWEVIAYSMDITPQWVYKLHSKALQKVEEILDKRGEGRV